jgi:SAM-dependent methyltransferase
MPRGGRLLDVGAGTGGFLRVLLANTTAQWEAMGVDCARTDTPLDGPTILKGTLADVPARERFDVITFLDTLCMLANPREELRRARQHLRPGGIVLVEEANTTGRRLLRMGPIAWLRTGRWNGFDPGVRRFFFTPKTLSLLMRESGFQEIRLYPGCFNRPGSNFSGLLRRAGDVLNALLYKRTGRVAFSPRVISLSSPANSIKDIT